MWSKWISILENKVKGSCWVACNEHWPSFEESHWSWRCQESDLIVWRMLASWVIFSWSTKKDSIFTASSCIITRNDGISRLLSSLPASVRLYASVTKPKGSFRNASLSQTISEFDRHSGEQSKCHASMRALDTWRWLYMGAEWHPMRKWIEYCRVGSLGLLCRGSFSMTDPKYWLVAIGPRWWIKPK